MRIIAFAVLVAGCGSVTTQSLLVAGKDSEASDVALDASLDVGNDGGVDGKAHDGAVPDAVVGDGPWGGLHTVDIPALRNDTPPMRGRWTIGIGACVGSMTVALMADGSGWNLSGPWSCDLAQGALTGHHDWTTDAVDLSLAGDGGGVMTGGALSLPGGAGRFVLTGVMRGASGDLSFHATHD